MMHMTFYWGLDMALWAWEVSGPASYAAALTAIVSLAVAHEALASHRAAVAKACACGPACAGAAAKPPAVANGSAPPPPPTRPPAVAAPAPAPPAPTPAPCCCGPAPGAGTASASLTDPLLAAENGGGGGGGGGGSSTRPAGRRPAVATQPSPSPAALDTAAYALHAATSYLLMLAVMTFNLGACAAVLVGLAGGHAAFAGRGAARLGDACCAPAGGALEAEAAQARAAGEGEEWDGPPGMVP